MSLGDLQTLNLGGVEVEEMGTLPYSNLEWTMEVVIFKAVLKSRKIWLCLNRAVNPAQKLTVKWQGMGSNHF